MKLLSILIITSEGREAQLRNLLICLKTQIKNSGIKDKVQILTFKDKPGQYTFGIKNNALYAGAIGSHAMVIRDCDLLEDNTLAAICIKIQTENPDCISLVGNIKEVGKPDVRFVQSIKYKQPGQEGAMLFGPPNYFNALKTSIVQKHKFLDQDNGADAGWAMQLSSSGALQSEATIDTPTYIFNTAM